MIQVMFILNAKCSFVEFETNVPLGEVCSEKSAVSSSKKTKSHLLPDLKL